MKCVELYARVIVNVPDDVNIAHLCIDATQIAFRTYDGINPSNHVNAELVAYETMSVSKVDDEE